MAGDMEGASALLIAATRVAQRYSRYERQRLQIVRLAFAGAWDRADGLASEHLAEFDGDELIQALRNVFGKRKS